MQWEQRTWHNASHPSYPLSKLCGFRVELGSEKHSWSTGALGAEPRIWPIKVKSSLLAQFRRPCYSLCLSLTSTAISTTLSVYFEPTSTSLPSKLRQPRWNQVQVAKPTVNQTDIKHKTGTTCLVRCFEVRTLHIRFRSCADSVRNWGVQSALGPQVC